MVSSTGRNLVPISAYVIAIILTSFYILLLFSKYQKCKEIFPTYLLTYILTYQNYLHVETHLSKQTLELKSYC